MDGHVALLVAAVSLPDAVARRRRPTETTRRGILCMVPATILLFRMFRPPRHYQVAGRLYPVGEVVFVRSIASPRLAARSCCSFIHFCCGSAGACRRRRCRDAAGSGQCDQPIFLDTLAASRAAVRAPHRTEFQRRATENVGGEFPCGRLDDNRGDHTCCRMCRMQ